MPLFDCSCSKCGKVKEVYVKTLGGLMPDCCGEVMTRTWNAGNQIVKMKYPLWIDRIDEIHKAQADRGERLRMPHPKEVGAT
jgi:hypothetical protein